MRHNRFLIVVITGWRNVWNVWYAFICELIRMELVKGRVHAPCVVPETQDENTVIHLPMQCKAWLVIMIRAAPCRILTDWACWQSRLKSDRFAIFTGLCSWRIFWIISYKVLSEILFAYGWVSVSEWVKWPWSGVDANITKCTKGKTWLTNKLQN